MTQYQRVREIFESSPNICFTNNDLLNLLGAWNINPRRITLRLQAEGIIENINGGPWNVWRFIPLERRTSVLAQAGADQAFAAPVV